jgi:hypothetical protein
MQTRFVLVECDIHAQVSQQPFRYRAYIADELFAERTWIWQDSYLAESFQIEARPGIYQIKFETVDPQHGMIRVQNHRVLVGPGQIVNHQGHPAVEIT